MYHFLQVVAPLAPDIPIVQMFSVPLVKILINSGNSDETSHLLPAGDVGDIDEGLATPLEVFQGLALEGYQLTYQRVPLSRERTPEAADLDALHRQALQQPGGAPWLPIWKDNPTACSFQIDHVWVKPLLVSMTWVLFMCLLASASRVLEGLTLCWKLVA